MWQFFERWSTLSRNGLTKNVTWLVASICYVIWKKVKLNIEIEVKVFLYLDSIIYGNLLHCFYIF